VITPLRCSGMARVLKRSHSFTCTPRVHPLTEWTIPAFAYAFRHKLVQPEDIWGLKYATLRQLADSVNVFLPALLSQLNRSKKVKAEHLYSALHGIQTTLKRSDIDHTVYLQSTPYLPCALYLWSAVGLSMPTVRWRVRTVDGDIKVT